MGRHPWIVQTVSALFAKAPTAPRLNRKRAIYATAPRKSEYSFLDAVRQEFGIRGKVHASRQFPPQQFLDLPHDLRDAQFLPQYIVGQLFGREVLEIVLGVRVLDVEVAVVLQ